MKKNYNILIYGAGAIGSIYAVILSKAGYNIAIYARSSRLQTLKSQGLLYYDKGIIKKASVRILEKVSSADTYDYILLTVRYEQIGVALAELSGNESETIVTMVNNPDGYSQWENIVGKGRILPAFAGAGGRIEKGVLYFQLTPKIIQPTTFGEINGEKTTRIRDLAEIFYTGKVPFSISNNMDAWQKSHIAMIVSLAKGFYCAGGDNYTTAKNKKALRVVSLSARENFEALKRISVPITPAKLNIFRICPLWLMDFALGLVFNTKFAETVMSSHAIIAKDEMLLLEKRFNELVRGN